MTMPPKATVTPGGSANRAADKPDPTIAEMRAELDRFKVATEHAIADLKSTVERNAAEVAKVFVGVREALDDLNKRTKKVGK